MLSPNGKKILTVPDIDRLTGEIESAKPGDTRFRQNKRMFAEATNTSAHGIGAQLMNCRSKKNKLNEWAFQQR